MIDRYPMKISFLREDQTENRFVCNGLNVAIMGIGEFGNQAINELPLLTDIRTENQILGNLFICNDHIVCTKNQTIGAELQSNDVLYALGDINDNSAIATACDIAKLFKENNGAHKHTLFICHETFDQERVSKLRQHYDIIIFVQPEHRLIDPLVFLYIKMLRVGWMGIDLADIFYILSKMSVGYHDLFTLKSLNDISYIVKSIVTKISTHKSFTKEKLVASIALTVHDTTDLDDIDYILSVLSKLISKDIIWNASFDPSFENGEVQIEMVLGEYKENEKEDT